MKVLMLEAPEELLDARRRRSADKLDEVWEGVLRVRLDLDGVDASV